MLGCRRFELETMKTKIVIAALTFASFQFIQAADITGKITLAGTPPPERELSEVKANADCGKLHKEVPKTRFFVVGPNKELADVVVSLKGISGKSAGESAQPVLIDQVACEYSPYVTAVQTKQKIKVRNSDPFMHNVHPVPAAPGNKESNKAQMPKAPDFEYAFENPESFLKFKCDVHPWMFSYVTVFDHPYFAVSQKDGTFTIKNVPPGKYTIEAVHRKAPPVTKEIEVKDANVTADLTVEVK